MEDILVIGIAGGSGSGKTTLMKNLMEKFGEVTTVLSHDNYYKRHDELSYEERCLLNYDEPAAFDTSLMVYQLDQLRHGKAIDCPVYDFTTHNRSNDTIHIEPSRVIIVEGILIFENQQLRDLMDIRIFVDADADIRLCRRTERPEHHAGIRRNRKLHRRVQTIIFHQGIPPPNLPPSIINDDTAFIKVFTKTPFPFAMVRILCYNDSIFIIPL